MSLSILTTQLSFEHDVVLARQRARQVAKLLGFDAQDQTRIATAVSEIARNALSYAGGGRGEFYLNGKTPPQVMVIRISDRDKASRISRKSSKVSIIPARVWGLESW